MSSETRKPLKLRKSDWKSRWLVFPAWGILHRVSEIAWDDNREKIRGKGVTVCGRRGLLMMPGFPSRIGLMRCPKCCERLGIPQGNGAPFNSSVLDNKYRSR